MNKQFFAVIVVIVAGLVGIFALTSGKEDANNSSGGNTDTSSKASNHIEGKADSKVTFIEYGDFQCPACKSYYPIVKQIKEDYKDKVRFQFRHFPLVQIHPSAFIASRAAEAAGKQNKFYEMHDLMYENQDTWSSSANPTPIFEAYAKQLDLNVDQFKTDMNSSAVADTINADAKTVQTLGGNSTPTFVLNDRKIESPKSIDEFKKLLDEELAKNQ